MKPSASFYWSWAGFPGLVHPHEAGGIGAFGVLAVSVLRRQMTWRGFVLSLYETMVTSCMTMLLVAGATVFGHFLAITRIPFEIAGWVEHLALPPFAIIAVIVAIYLVGGVFHRRPGPDHVNHSHVLSHSLQSGL